MSAPALNNLGVVQLRRAAAPTAGLPTSFFNKAREADPADPAPHYRLSRLYDRLGKSDAARAEREKHAKLVEAQQAVR